MTRTNYTQPQFITRAYDLAANEHDPELLTTALHDMTARHDGLMQAMYRLIDNYDRLLETHGPHHEIELGEPLSRVEIILRKALNET